MGVRRVTFDTYSTVFGIAYLCLVTNLLLVAGCLPVVGLLVTTDPARSWPLLAVAAPLGAPGVAAAFAVFRDHADGGTDVVRAFLAGWRACWRPALRLAALTTAVVVVALVDIRMLAGSAAGVVVIPALVVLAVTAVAVGLVGLVAITEAPQARLRDVIRVSGYLAVRRWFLTLATLAVLGIQVAVFTSHPAIALGVTAAPALYVAWANSRYVLAPALAATVAASAAGASPPPAQRPAHPPTTRSPRMTSTRPSPPARGVAGDPAIAAAVATVRRNIGAFGAEYPDDTTRDGRYPLRPGHGRVPDGSNHGWTTSFWSGMRWVAWELTGDDVFRDAARRDSADFQRRVHAGEGLETHDLGFLYTLSCVAPWRLLGDEEARKAALVAADHLMRRFLEPAGIIQAWGHLADPAQRGRTIIDSLMNLPLLTWASEQTGDARYADAARRHALQLRDHIIREDGSTFHTFYWDADTGAPLRGATEQGAGDDSCWARGQAWGLYGFALSARATQDAGMLDAARRCAEYFIAHLPADRVPCWDLAYGDEPGALRDSSAAAIAASGLLELAALDDDTRSARWSAEADGILSSLARHHTPAFPEDSDALLLHGVYDLPKGIGVDEGTLWGDYFYLEALMRRTRPAWRPYW